MYAALSDRSRHYRFQISPPRLPESYLRLLVDKVDQIDHVALVALAAAGTEVERPVGVGRIVRYRTVPETADIAVTLVDGWHRRGVGLTLASLLVQNRPAGVSRLVTTISADNAAALALLARLGTVASVAAGHGTYEVTVELHCSADTPTSVGPDVLTGAAADHVAQVTPAAETLGVRAAVPAGPTVRTARRSRRAHSSEGF